RAATPSIPEERGRSRHPHPRRRSAMSESSHAATRRRETNPALGKSVRQHRLSLAAAVLLKILACGGAAWMVQQRADAAFGRALALKPDDPQAQYRLGNTLYEKKKYAEAVAAYRKAIELQPDYPEPYNGLGNALAGQKKLDEAVAAFRR